MELLELLLQAVEIVAFILLWQGTLRLASPARAWAQMVVSLGGVAVFYFCTGEEKLVGVGSLVYLIATTLPCWVVLRPSPHVTHRRARLALKLLAAWLPIVMWVLLKPWPLLAPDGLPLFGRSFLAFRLSLLAIDVHRGAVKAPSLPTFLAFAFYPPSFLIGPISPFAVWQEPPPSGPTPQRRLVGRAALRFLLGATKYLTLATLVERVGFASLWVDGFTHGPFDFFVSIVAAHVFFYLNFSGYCDMGVAVAALAGSRLVENFDRPFFARNLQDYWHRWHATLGAFLRQLIHLPLSRQLGRRLGSRRAWLATAIATMVVFVLSGLWHGQAAHYAIWGAWHGVGVVAVQLIARWGGRRPAYVRWTQSRAAAAFSITLTFLYASFGYWWFLMNPAGSAEVLGWFRWSS